MSNFDRVDFNQIFRERKKNFSIAIIRILSSLPYSDDISIIRNKLSDLQLLWQPITEL